MRRALITGITGQDGSYLAELLLDKGYEVHGIVRRSSTTTTGRLDQVANAAGAASRLVLHNGDLSDGASLARLMGQVRPDEVYNLAAMSDIPVSVDVPEYVLSTNAGGPVRLLEAIRSSAVDCRYFQASTSEMFGFPPPPPQSEETPFHPRSPYGTSKLFAHWTCVNYREAHGMYAVSGILFNHESPRRGEQFVTRKITRAVARIAAGLQDEVALGSLDGVRDRGYAPEYVEGMWRMLQHDEPIDFVLATGIGTTVRDFVETAFDHAGLTWSNHVRHDPRFERPPEVHALVGNAEKAHRLLGWKAQTHAADVARLMVDADRALLRG